MIEEMIKFKPTLILSNSTLVPENFFDISGKIEESLGSETDMEEKDQFTLQEAHLNFAKSFNGKVWELLEKADRTPDEDQEMVMAAYASAYYWRFAGTPLNQQRGEWLLA